MTALQIQIPFELIWSRDPPTDVVLIVNDNGTQSEPFLLAPRLDIIHVLTTCETQGRGCCRMELVRLFSLVAVLSHMRTGALFHPIPRQRQEK